MKKKVIGVLGGMGPESTAIFYQALIKQCQKIYGAYLDGDYPEIFIYNLPIPDVVLGFEKPGKTSEILVNGSKKLIQMGADFLVMPCNTVHYFYPQIIQAISNPFICIFLATAKKIKEKGIKKVGFLSTETTLKYQSFGDDFSRNDIELILPTKNAQKQLTQIIINILAGQKNEVDKKTLITIIHDLKERGAQGIVLSCTDLPILLKQDDVEIPLFDTVDILAEVSVDFCLNRIGNEILL